METQSQTTTPLIKVGRKAVRRMAIGDKIVVSTGNLSSLRNNLYAMSSKEGVDNGYRLAIVNEGDGRLSIEKQPIVGSVEGIRVMSLAIRVALARRGEMSEKDLFNAVGAKDKEWSFYSALTELEDAHRIRFTESCTYAI